MDDDIDRDRWLDSRLKALRSDAMAAPRRRLVLPTAAVGDPAERGWWRKHRLVAALALLNAATGAALGLSLSRHGAPSSAPAAPTPAVDAAGTVTGTAPLDMALRGDMTQPPTMALASGSVWVPDAGGGAVLRVDERTLRVVARIAVDGAASTGLAVASDGTSLWATAPGRDAVVRIDPTTNRVADAIAVGDRPTALAVDGDRLWIAVGAEGAPHGRLIEVDLRQRRIVLSVDTGRGPDRVVAGHAAVWVLNHADGTVTRVDESTARAASTQPNPLDYDYGYVGVGVDGTGAWAVDNNRSVLEHIDGATLVPAEAVSVGRAPVGLAIAGGTAWSVAAAGLTRIDLRTGASSSLGLTGKAWNVVVGDGAVWVLTGDGSGAVLVRVSPP